MMFRLRNWRPAQLLTAWCLYWLALVLAVLGPALPAFWRVTRPDAHGTVSATYGDGVLKLLVTEAGKTIWSRDIGLTAMLLALAVPPLVLWALWLRAQRTHEPSIASPQPR